MFPNPDQDPSSPYTRTDLMRYLEAQIRQAGGDPEALLQGSDHPYTCTCETCWSWWKQMGLGDEPNPPFTQEEIDASSYAEALVIKARNLSPVDITELVLQEARKQRGGGLL